MSVLHKPISIQSDGDEDANYLVDEFIKMARRYPGMEKTKPYKELINLRGELDSLEFIEYLDRGWRIKFERKFFDVGTKIFDVRQWNKLSARMRKNRSRRLAKLSGDSNRKVPIDISVESRFRMQELKSEYNLDTYDDVVQFLLDEFLGD